MDTTNPPTPPDSSGWGGPFPDADRTGRFHPDQHPSGVHRPPHPGRRCAAGQESRL
jgi:hypothetical protein